MAQNAHSPSLLEALIRARLSSRGAFVSDELEGAVAEAARLARDVAALRGALAPADSPHHLARIAPARRDDAD